MKIYQQNLCYILLLSRLRCSYKRVLWKYLAANQHEHNVHPPIFQKGGLDRMSVFRGGCWEWGGGGGRFQVLLKNKLKSEIFNDKKSKINKNVFLYHNLEFNRGRGGRGGGGRGLVKKRRVVFLREDLIPQCTLWWEHPWRFTSMRFP